MDSYLTIEEKHNRYNYNLNWSQNNHYFNHINCGYSCPCCLAKIQKQTYPLTIVSITLSLANLICSLLERFG